MQLELVMILLSLPPPLIAVGQLRGYAKPKAVKRCLWSGGREEYGWAEGRAGWYKVTDAQVLFLWAKEIIEGKELEAEWKTC